MLKIGIRHEDKSKWERRTPLLPEYVKNLMNDNTEFLVENSDKRCVSAEEYTKVNAKMTDNLDEADIILGIKEVPINKLLDNKVYCFFSHVIKGQKYNMPLLQAILDKKITLIDYERIVDENNKRLVYFGWFAGVVGALESLRGYGDKLELQGQNNPFKVLEPTYSEKDFETIKTKLQNINQEIKKNGIEDNGKPCIVLIGGYGNTSKGAQDIFELLGATFIEPENVKDIARKGKTNTIYVSVLKKPHLLKKKDGGAFDEEEYKAKPHQYKSNIEEYLPYAQMYLNCIYWKNDQPRIITKEMCKNLNNVQLIGDITLDIEGSVEITHDSVEPDEPFFTYFPETDTYQKDIQSDGISLMLVDILPCELPRESSKEFGAMLMPFVKTFEKCDFDSDFEDLDLPQPIKTAIITHKGALTPDYKYLEKYLS